MIILLITQLRIARFRSILYGLWSRDTRYTTNVQGQGVKGSKVAPWHNV